jgi:hypothetical protein
MAYLDFLKNIDDKFQALFNEISAEYNFDNGPEFEIALCKVFRIILPNKYGICRGFIVSKDGKVAGDDIIIYDQERFPTLRLLEDNTFAQKQKIPVEAVYAYIEAKHTLCLEGNGGQSLQKSLDQITSIKEIERKQVPLTQITPQVAIQSYNANWPNYWPNYRNPLYTAIISRQVRLKENSPVLNHSAFFPDFESVGRSIITDKNTPDLIIAGCDVVAIPAVGTQVESPFFVPGVSKLAGFETKGQAFGLGIINIMYAFDHIMLGNIHWPSILSDGLNLDLKM